MKVRINEFKECSACHKIYHVKNLKEGFCWQCIKEMDGSELEKAELDKLIKPNPHSTQPNPKYGDPYYFDTDNFFDTSDIFIKEGVL